MTANAPTDHPDAQLVEAARSALRTETTRCTYCGRETGFFTGYDGLERCAGCEAIAGSSTKPGRAIVEIGRDGASKPIYAYAAEYAITRTRHLLTIVAAQHLPEAAMPEHRPEPAAEEPEPAMCAGSSRPGHDLICGDCSATAAEYRDATAESMAERVNTAIYGPDEETRMTAVAELIGAIQCDDATPRALAELLETVAQRAGLTE